MTAACHEDCFVVDAGHTPLTVRVLSPPAGQLAPDPALLFAFAGACADNLGTEPYCLAARAFLAAGHRAASFDLPAHGARADARWEGITAWRHALMDGEDVFARFVAEGRAVISACIARGLARPGRLAAAGTSRGGYMSLRLLAGDDRVAAAAGFAPVTDWRHLDEFAADRDAPVVAAQALHEFLPQLTGRPIYLTIGGSDDRVSTESCAQLAAALDRANAPRRLVQFDLTDDVGHTMGPHGYARGAAFLLDHFEHRDEHWRQI